MTDLWLFLHFLAKVALLTGLGPAIAIAFLYVQVSRRRTVSHSKRDGLIPAPSNRDGNKFAVGNVSRAA
jgi:hypothetical protein